MADVKLNRLTEETGAVADAIVQLYDNIRAMKRNNYSYTELEDATGMARGTLQTIAAGGNPRFSLK